MTQYSEHWPHWQLVRTLNTMFAYGSLLHTTPSDTMSSVSTTPLVVDIFDAASDDGNGHVDAVLSPDYSLTINTAGDYFVTAFVSVEASAAGSILTVQEYVGGVAGNLMADRKLPATDVGSMCISGIQTYAAADEIDLRVSLDTGTVNLTFWGAGLTLQRVG
jgi:hypothetical protein